MAQATFQAKGEEQVITKRFGAPKTSSMDAWFKQTRKFIPELPNPKKTDWQIVNQEADYQWIRFELRNSLGEECKVVIDRRAPFLGV